MKTSFPSLRNLKRAGFGAVAALAFALPSSSALAGALDDVKARGEFTYGLEAQYRPFEFRDENNEIVGYDIDVANEIASRLGVKATPVDTNWAAVIQSLYTGQFDLILGGMTATPERYKRVNFSYPYMEASSGLLVRSDSGIADASGLGGKVVGAGAGTPSIKMLQMSAEEHGHEFGDDIKTYDDDAVAYEAMRGRSGRSLRVVHREPDGVREDHRRGVRGRSLHVEALGAGVHLHGVPQGGRGSPRSVQRSHRGDEGRRHPRGAPDEVVRAVLRGSAAQRSPGVVGRVPGGARRSGRHDGLRWTSPT